MKIIHTIIVAALAVIGTCALAETSATITLPADANSTCPIMRKESVDPELFVDYKGRRVYLCCAKCKRSFAKDPEKYMARLQPQKPGAAAPAKP